MPPACRPTSNLANSLFTREDGGKIPRLKNDNNFQVVACAIICVETTAKDATTITRYTFWSLTQAKNLRNPTQNILFKLETISKGCGNYSTSNTIGKPPLINAPAHKNPFGIIIKGIS